MITATDCGNCAKNAQLAMIEQQAQFSSSWLLSIIVSVLLRDSRLAISCGHIWLSYNILLWEKAYYHYVSGHMFAGH